MTPGPSGRVRIARAWLGLWLLASVVPFVAPAWRLAGMAMTDVPEAYLATIPVAAFAWAGWTLSNASLARPQARRRLDAPIALALGACLVLAGMQWLVPHGVGVGDALVLWPLWSAGVAVAFWGRGALRVLWAPLAYLVLAWPPPYLAVIAAIDPTLIRWGYMVLVHVARTTTWMHPLSALPVRFGIQTPSGPLDVNVTAACSGSDSILALIVLFPVLLALFRGSIRRKVLLVLVGVIGAFVANLVRILTIVWVAHAVSVPLAFNVVHPILGPFLFAALVLAVLLGGGLTARAGATGPLDSAAMPAPSSGATVCVVVASLCMMAAVRPGLG